VLQLPDAFLLAGLVVTFVFQLFAGLDSAADPRDVGSVRAIARTRLAPDPAGGAGHDPGRPERSG